MKKIKFFDVCGTLYESNTTFDFLAYYLSDRFDFKIYQWIRKFTLIRIFNKMLIRLFNIDLIRIIGVSFLDESPKDVLVNSAKKFLTTIDEKKEVLDYLKSSVSEKNTEVALISASLDFIVQAVAETWNIHSYFCTELEYENGVCKGRIQNDLLGVKENKVKEYFSKMNVEVVTDNTSDFELVKRADRAIIITNSRNVKFWSLKKDRLKNVEFW